MTDITVPGTAVVGAPGHVPDHNTIYAALLSLQEQFNALSGGTLVADVTDLKSRMTTVEGRADGHDTDISALQARPTFEVSATEPAHDGHQRVGNLWIVKA